MHPSSPAAAACPTVFPRPCPLTPSSLAALALYVATAMSITFPSAFADTSQPCTVRDFMNFLKYIELSAENLQFFLWYRDYVKRFNALPESERVLSPEWTGEKNPEARPGTVSYNADAAAMLKGTDFANEGKVADSEKGSNNPFFTPPRTPTSVEPRRDYSLDSYDDSMTTGKVDHTQRAAGAFDNAGLKWKPREYYLC